MLRECLHHIRPVQQRPACPELAVLHPSLLLPFGSRRLVAEHVKHEPRAGGLLPIEQPRMQRDLDTATDGQEGGARFVTLTDEGQLGGVRRIAHVVGTDEHDVKRRAGLEGIGRQEGNSARETAWSGRPSLRDPVEGGLDGLRLHVGGDDVLRKRFGEVLAQAVDEVDRCDIENLRLSR